MAGESKKVQHAVEKYCPGLVSTVSAHTTSDCIDARLDGIFANPGAKSGLDCFLQLRPRPCSSCMWRLHKAREAQGLLPTPDASASSVSAECGHEEDRRPAVSDAAPVDRDGVDAQTRAPEKQRATTKAMRVRVERALDDFCMDARAQLPDSSDPAVANLPASFFIPHSFRLSLLEVFSAASLCDSRMVS